MNLPHFDVEELPGDVMLFPGLPVWFDEARLRKAMQLRPGGKDEATFDELLRTARAHGSPKAVYRHAPVTEHSENGVCIEGVSFESPLLQRQLAGIHRVFPYLVTCGTELAALKPASRTTLERYYWGEICTAILRGAHRLMQAHLQHRFQIPKTSYLSPGSGAAWLWSIAQQANLFALFGDTPAKIGVTLTEDNIMLPARSLSGLHYPSEKAFRTCGACRIENCPDRLAPFDPKLWSELKRLHE
mgnify:CR=1 FL=1